MTIMKKRVFIFAVLLSVVLPFKVKALGSIAIDCEQEVLEVGQSTTCKITGTSTNEVAALSFDLLSNDRLVISDIKTSSIWQGDGEDGKIGLYTDNNKIGTFAIATLKITATDKVGTGKMEAKNLLFTNAAFENQSLDNVDYTIQIKEKNQNTPPKEEEDQPSINPPGNTENDTNDKSDINNKNDIDDTKVENPKTGFYTISITIVLGLVIFIGIILYKKNYFCKIS